LAPIKFVGKGFIAGGADPKTAQIKGLVISLQNEMSNPEGGFILRAIRSGHGIKGTYESVLKQMKEILDARTGGGKKARTKGRKAV